MVSFIESVEPLEPVEPLERLRIISSACIVVLVPLVVPERALPAGSAMLPSLRIVRLDPVPVPGVCVPVAEFGVPSAGRVCSGFGLVVEFIMPGVEGAVSDAVCAPARPVATRRAAARAVLQLMM